MKSLICWCVVMATALGFATDDAVDHVDEALTITVPSGETWTYSGVLSGTTAVNKLGLGKLILGNAENTFSGGITISEGTLEVTAAGALGDEANTIRILASVASQACLSLQPSTGRMTVNNLLQPMIGGGNVEVPRTQPVITCRGHLVFARDLLFDRSSGYKTSYGVVANTDENGSVTYNGDFGSNDRVAYPYTNAKCPVHYKGKVFGSTKMLLRNGDVHFYAPDNNLKVLQWAYLAGYPNTVYCEAENTMNGCTLTWSDGGGYLDLQGLDQTVSSLAWDRLLSSGNYYGNGVTQRGITSTEPATLTIVTGAAASTYADTADNKKRPQVMLGGRVSLDVNLANAENCQFLYNRQHSTTGTLTVRNGTLWLGPHTLFKHVPQVTVRGAAARLLLEVDQLAAFDGLTQLSVLEGGTFEMATDTVPNPFNADTTVAEIDYGSTLKVPGAITLKALRYRATEGGEWTTLSAGVHACDGSIPQLVGGGTVTIPAAQANVPSSWTGRGESAAVLDSSNWSASGESAREGALAPTFATAGTEATVAAPIGFYNITFDAPNDFTVKTNGATAAISLLGNTITSVGVTLAEGESARTYAIEPPLTLANQLTDYDDFVVRAGANTVVKLNDVTSEKDFRVLGTGTVELSGTSTFYGRAESMVDNTVRGVADAWRDRTATIVARGLIVSPGFENRVISSASDAHAFVFGTYGQAPDPSVVPTYLTLDGVEIRMPMRWNGRASSRTSVTINAGTTNLISGYVLSDSASTLTITMGANSYLEFAGGASFPYSLIANGDSSSTIVFSKTFSFRGGGTRHIGSVGKVVYSSRGNSSNYNGNMGRWMLRGANSTIETTVDEVWANGQLYFNARGGLVDLKATKQSIDSVRSLSEGEITGQYPSCLEVTLGASEADKAGTNVCCQVTGGVSLMKGGSGTGVLYLTGKAFESFGDLIVTNGVLELAANATWLNGTNFVSRGEGTLKFNATKQVNSEFAKLHLAENGKVEIPSGATLRVASVALNGGEPITSGSFKAADGSAVGAHLTGAGTLNVGRTGLVLIFK